MKQKKSFTQFLLLTLVGGVASGCSVFGIRSEEQPSYEILLKQENLEIRKYQPNIVAKTTVQGTFKEAQSQGFKILAGYIFGKNKSQQKIAMTAPVIQKAEDKSEKIAMTAPVIIKPGAEQNDSTKSSWTMTFSMPSEYSLETLPVPEDSRINLVQEVSRIVAANVFTGFWGESKNQKKANELLTWLKENKKYEAISKPMFAGYNPPWTLPFFRHNEMLIEVKSIEQSQ